MARKALGRGLDALIPGAGAAREAGTRLLEIPLEKIRPNPRQPRERFEPTALASIADSVRQHGVLQPLVVRNTGDSYEIVAGERRWRAAQMAGLEKVPAVVRDVTPRESLELAIIENVQREDLNPIEEALAYRILTDDMGLTQQEAAERVGRDRATVANYLRLLNLPENVQALVISGELQMGHARALLALEDGAEITRLAMQAAAGGWSVRQIEARVRATSRGPRTVAAPRRDPDVQAAESKLSRALGAPVTIRGREKGRVEIRFASMDELNRLYDVLLKSGRG